jgi:hypothetical protein
MNFPERPEQGMRIEESQNSKDEDPEPDLNPFDGLQFFHFRSCLPLLRGGSESLYRIGHLGDTFTGFVNFLSS